MSNSLLLLVALIYIIVGINNIYEGKIGLMITFISYAISCVGLYLTSRGI